MDRPARAAASAPGKVILFGEHAVVYGEASLSLAINRRTRVQGEPRPDATTVNGYPLDTVHHGYIHQALRAGWQGGPLRLETHSDIPSASGVGSSAALSVATVAVLQRLRGEATDPRQVALGAFETEFETQGAASPNDTTVSSAGGGVLLAPRALDLPGVQPLWEIHRGERRWAAHRVRLPSLPLVVATCARKSRTSEQVAKVRRFVEHNAFGRDVVKEIGRITLEGLHALDRGDLRRVGQLMNRNHECLHTLGVDSPELARLIDAARKAPGTFGAKITGAGGGGSIVVLTEEPEEARRILEPLSLHAFVVQPDLHGVLIEA